MKKDDTDLSHLMGWFVACVVVGCMVIEMSSSGLPGGRRIGKFVYDYQALLTGFLAAGAAFVTVHFLRRQIDIAQMQARDTFTIGLRRNRAIAVKAIAAARDMNSWLVLESFTPQRLATEAGWSLYARDLRRFRDLADDVIFDVVESEIGYPPGFGISFVRGSIRDFMEERRALFEMARMFDEEIGAKVLQSWGSVMKSNSIYCKEIISLCEDFLAEGDAILTRYQ